MNSEILEKGLQKLSDALSEFDDAPVDVQMNSVPGPTESDIRRRRLIAEIDCNLSDVSNLSSIKDFRGSWEPETRPYFRQSLAASVSVSFPNTYKQSTLRRY